MTGADDQSAKVTDGKVRMALIGGGEGAFIGPVHRMAAELDGIFAAIAADAVK